MCDFQPLRGWGNYLQILPVALVIAVLLDPALVWTWNAIPRNRSLRELGAEAFFVGRLRLASQRASSLPQPKAGILRTDRDQPLQVVRGAGHLCASCCSRPSAVAYHAVRSGPGSARNCSLQMMPFSDMPCRWGHRN